MPFIDQNFAFILHPIGVRSSWADAHQNDAVTASQPEVHTTLEIDADCGAHCGVGNHIAGLKSLSQDEWIIDAGWRRQTRAAGGSAGTAEALASLPLLRA